MDGHDGRIVLFDILFQPALRAGRGVSADSGVDEADARVGIPRAVEVGYELVVASAVRDRVAEENDSVAVLERLRAKEKTSKRNGGKKRAFHDAPQRMTSDSPLRSAHS